MEDVSLAGSDDVTTLSLIEQVITALAQSVRELRAVPARIVLEMVEEDRRPDTVRIP